MAAGRNNVKIYSPTGRAGFTLVEVLIAIFIFAIVISTVYGSYRATFQIVHGSEFQLKIADSARVVAERLAEDLGSLVTGPGGLFLGETHEFSGARGDSLSFVSAAHLILRKNDNNLGPVLVEYLVESDEETGFLDLYRSDMVLLPGTTTDGGERQRHLLCRGLREFRITYLDGDGNETDDWQVDEVVPEEVVPNEDSSGAEPEESSFPALVSIELRFAESVESDGSTVFKTAVALP